MHQRAELRHPVGVFSLDRHVVNPLNARQTLAMKQGQAAVDSLQVFALPKALSRDPLRAIDAIERVETRRADALLLRLLVRNGQLEHLRIQVGRRRQHDPSLARLDRGARFVGDYGPPNVRREDHFPQGERYGHARADMRAIPLDPVGWLQNLHVDRVFRSVWQTVLSPQAKQPPRARIDLGFARGADRLRYDPLSHADRFDGLAGGVLCDNGRNGWQRIARRRWRPRRLAGKKRRDQQPSNEPPAPAPRDRPGVTGFCGKGRAMRR